MCERREVWLRNSMREERIRDEKRREGWRRGRCIDGWMYEPHPFSPPLRGEERVWGSPNLPTAASPLLKRGVDGW